MRKNVIKFFKNLPEEPSAQYNEALVLFRNSPEANPQQVRFYNVQTYTPQRLNDLFYDLKNLHQITDADLFVPSKKKSTEKSSSKPQKNEIVYPENFPKFKGGSEGNRERKAYIKEHGITAVSGKSKDIDVAIIEHLNTLAKKEAADKLNAERFDKIVSVFVFGDDVPASLVRDVYESPKMTDEEVKDIIENAAAVAKDVTKTETPVQKNDTDITNIETTSEEVTGEDPKETTPEETTSDPDPAPEKAPEETPEASQNPEAEKK